MGGGVLPIEDVFLATKPASTEHDGPGLLAKEKCMAVPQILALPGRTRSSSASSTRRWFARILGLVAAVSMVALAAITPALAATEALIQISSDPYTNPTSQHKTQVEPDTFSFGSTVVAAFQSGRFFDGGASNIGFSTSLDRGRTWHPGFLPGTTVFATPAGKYTRVSDPSVAYDAGHNVWLISYLGIFEPPNAADVLVSRSTDGGLTWGNPVGVDVRGTKSGHLLDKNWTVCDNSTRSQFFGNCYTEYDDFNLGDLEQMSTSSDGGLIWGAPRTPADGVSGIAGQPLVRPNGVVVVPYINLDGAVFRIADFISVDGGFSWSASTLVANVDFHTPNGNIRAGLPAPTAEIDASGRIYVAWSDCRFEAQCSTSDIVFSTSDDGVRWSPVHRVPIDPIGSPADNFIPGLAVDRSSPSSGARLALAYYFYPQGNCTSVTCQLEVGFITSTNGGATWSKAETLAGPMKLSWLADTTQGRMVGDYISTSIPPGKAAASPVFDVGFAPPKPGVFDEATYTVREDVTAVRGGSQSSAADRPVATSTAAPARSSGRRPTAF